MQHCETNNNDVYKYFSVLCIIVGVFYYKLAFTGGLNYAKTLTWSQGKYLL